MGEKKFLMLLKVTYFQQKLWVTIDDKKFYQPHKNTNKKTKPRYTS